MSSDHIIYNLEGVGEGLILGSKVVLSLVGNTAIAVGGEATKLVEGEVHKTCFTCLSAEADGECLACIGRVSHESVKCGNSGVCVSVGSLRVLSKVDNKLTVGDGSKLLTVTAGVNGRLGSLHIVRVINRSYVRILNDHNIVDIYLCALICTAIKESVVKTECEVKVGRCVSGEHILYSLEGVGEGLPLGSKIVLCAVGLTCEGIGVEAAELIEREVHKTSLTSLSTECKNKGLACVCRIGEKLVKSCYSGITVGVGSLRILGKVDHKLTVYDSSELLTVATGINGRLGSSKVKVLDVGICALCLLYSAYNEITEYKLCGIVGGTVREIGEAESKCKALSLNTVGIVTVGNAIIHRLSNNELEGEGLPLGSKFSRTGESGEVLERVKLTLTERKVYSAIFRSLSAEGEANGLANIGSICPDFLKDGNSCVLVSVYAAGNGTGVDLKTAVHTLKPSPELVGRLIESITCSTGRGSLVDTVVLINSGNDLVANDLNVGNGLGVTYEDESDFLSPLLCHIIGKLGNVNKTSLFASANCKGSDRSVVVNRIKVYAGAVNIICGSGCRSDGTGGPVLTCVNVSYAVNGYVSGRSALCLEYKSCISTVIAVKRKLYVRLNTESIETVLAATDPETFLSLIGHSGKNTCGHGRKNIL